MTTCSLIIRDFFFWQKMRILKSPFFEDDSILIMGIRDFSPLLVWAWGGMMDGCSFSAVVNDLSPDKEEFDYDKWALFLYGGNWSFDRNVCSE